MFCFRIKNEEESILSHKSYSVVKLVLCIKPNNSARGPTPDISQCLCQGQRLGNQPARFDGGGNRSVQFLSQARGERGPSFCEATMLAAAPTCCDVHAV